MAGHAAFNATRQSGRSLESTGNATINIRHVRPDDAKHGALRARETSHPCYVLLYLQLSLSLYYTPCMYQRIRRSLMLVKLALVVYAMGEYCDIILYGSAKRQRQPYNINRTMLPHFGNNYCYSSAYPQHSLFLWKSGIVGWTEEVCLW